MNLKGNGIVSDAFVFTSVGFHSKPDTTDFVDAPAFASANEMECVKVNKDSTFKSSNEIFSHPASFEDHDNGRLIATSTFPYCNENHVSPVNESVIINEAKQLLFGLVYADFAKRFRLSIRVCAN
ncbi:uncharacterized protein LOC112680725 [Sipha flava]|uniref:Uncharacterized protein LOC112680725 n=1 Tax=Sipha flava TaxID=143950 RepID=A0A2S2QKX6_9HEMI|nr:uncharacterized protein LOC112680725 [Sipha flava]